jgi:hypothetical protein
MTGTSSVTKNVRNLRLYDGASSIHIDLNRWLRSAVKLEAVLRKLPSVFEPFSLEKELALLASV